MAMIERDVVLVGKDADGNTTVDMPITRLGNLEDTAETKTAPVSGDALAIVDSEANGEMKKIAWSDVAAALKDTVGGASSEALEALQQALDEHEADGAAHVTTSEKTAWNTKADGGHNHDATYAAKEHNHDGRYYTESEVNTLLANKENAGAAAGVQTAVESHAGDTVKHVTASERESWNATLTDAKAYTDEQIAELRMELGATETIAEPVQKGTLLYSGSAQSPVWSGYDNNKMTLSGTTSATNAGTYSATFKPKSKYVWEDGTNTAKEVSWSIGIRWIAVPYQVNTPYETGFGGVSVTPEWSSSYDSSIMTVSGDLSALYAGEYTVTFKLTDENCHWLGDALNSQTERKVKWYVYSETGEGPPPPEVSTEELVLETLAEQEARICAIELGV